MEKNKGSDWDMIMMSNDSIYIPTKDYSIEVYGKVMFPGKIQYKNGEKSNYYVEYSGGYSENADKKNTKIILPNGKILKNRRFGFDPVIPFGSKIFVPAKEGKQNEKI